MFGLGMPEILLIMAIALMVIGPKKLPELAKTLGRSMGEFKNAAQDFKRSIDMEETVKKFEEPTKNVRETINEITDPLGTKKSDDSQNDSSPDPKIVSDKDHSDTNLSATDQNKNKDKGKDDLQTQDKQEDEGTSQYEKSDGNGADK